MTRRWKPKAFQRLLEDRGLSLVALARKMSLGDSRLYVYFPTRDGAPAEREPSLEMIFDMCVAAGIRPSSVDSRLSDPQLAAESA